MGEFTSDERFDILMSIFGDRFDTRTITDEGLRVLANCKTASDYRAAAVGFRQDVEDALEYGHSDAAELYEDLAREAESCLKLHAVSGK